MKIFFLAGSQLAPVANKRDAAKPPVTRLKWSSQRSSPLCMRQHKRRATGFYSLPIKCSTTQLCFPWTLLSCCRCTPESCIMLSSYRFPFCPTSPLTSLPQRLCTTTGNLQPPTRQGGRGWHWCLKVFKLQREDEKARQGNFSNPIFTPSSSRVIWTCRFSTLSFNNSDTSAL